MNTLRREPERPLRSILIAEDEAIVALAMEDVVRELGAQHVQICADVRTALDAASTGQFDCAILDMMLRDGSSMDVADRLESRGIPLLFSTGSGGGELPERHRKHPILSKPFADEMLRATVQALLGHRGPILTT